MNTIENTKIENNKIIALFMGFVESGFERSKLYHSEKQIEINPIELWYDLDWNWLIEVVEQIENLETNRFDFQINQWNSRIFDHENTEFIVDLNANSKIESVYNACVEFIKWYNQNKN